ncbi:site-specific integrase [Xanthovirga aplysinae]|uniref:site-specific integrase n=1 Tax=Xanthovirga aplysinae TaxID=2529853 RepID=UPI0012BD49CD|nr:site-specific integrase [Xanthovirga aplysinae]MTI32893.1 site-specific integrase [Xanthovirga aplysinae]
MENTFNVLFWHYKYKTNKRGFAPIYARITINGKRAELSTHCSLPPEKWDAKKARAGGYSEEARTINARLDKINYKLGEIYHRLIDRGDVVSPKLIRDIYLGKAVRQHSIVTLMEDYTQRVKAQVGTTYTEGTYRKYKTSLSHLREFIDNFYKVEDIPLKKLTYQFIADFEYWLKSDKRNAHNAALKHIERVRKITKMAVDNEWVDKDPFAKFKARKEKTTREFLTEEELKVLEEKTFSVYRLQLVLDLFLFSCYTGLSYIDLKSITKDYLVTGIDNSKWLSSQRVKTGTPYNVPLLPKAEKLLEKYATHPEVDGTGKLLPVLSNQKLNAYLKEIADLCEIKKTLTFHMARHTFATTITLTNGVSIESVSAMLGHSDIKTTQIYAKVVQSKISEDMSLLRERLIKKEEQDKDFKNFI